MWELGPSWWRNEASIAVRRSRCCWRALTIPFYQSSERIRALMSAGMAWDFSTEPEFQAELDWMASFVREEVRPLELLDLSVDGVGRAVAPLQEQVKARGLWAAHLGPELGGPGFGQVKLGLMHEILGTTIYAPMVFGNQPPASGNPEIPALAGTDEQKDRWLHPLLAGDLRSAFSMTEPGAGADPTLLQTRAVPDGDGWLIDGHKWFSSNASIADFLIVMAVTDPDARSHQRASMFIVPVDTPGVEIVRDIGTMEHPIEGSFGKLGNHAEILYEDVRVPAENLLGDEGAGFLIAQQRLGPGRIHHCMRWLGVSQRAFDMLCERSLYREARGGPLADKQTIQNWIADSAAQMQAARLMTLHAAWRMDTQGASAARTDISLIKFYGAGGMPDVATARCRSTARSATPPTCRSRRCTATRAPRASTTDPTRCTASRSRGSSCAATRRRPTACRPSTSRRDARRRAGASPTSSRR